MTTALIRGNALALPLAAGTVDLIVTSPPYFRLRSYTDAGEHYAGQIGSEATPGEFLDALIVATAEMVRVLKPSGSIFVNLGDKYASYEGNRGAGRTSLQGATDRGRATAPTGTGLAGGGFVRNKSLMGLPWRYALRCIGHGTALADPEVVRLLLRDVALGVIPLAEAEQIVDELATTPDPGLGLILRAEVIWSKPNGLPESVTDRVRRSHEQWFHFTKQPRYFAAVDHIREPHTDITAHAASRRTRTDARLEHASAGMTSTANPLGKLPGSVWSVPTQPLTVPPSLGVDHFAAFPMEWPRRIIQGWSPSGICTRCGEGRRPVVDRPGRTGTDNNPMSAERVSTMRGGSTQWAQRMATPDQITGESCACPGAYAPTRPAVVLDPFGGTGTTAIVANALGRHGISLDMSADYLRLAGWRANDPGERAKAAGVDKPPVVPDDMDQLW